MSTARTVAAVVLAFASFATPMVAHAVVQLTIEVSPPQPVAGQPFHVVYGLRVQNDGMAQATPLRFPDMNVLVNPAPPSTQNMMVFGGFGGGAMFTVQTSVDYVVVAPRAGRFTISGARAVNPQDGRVVAQHPDVAINVLPQGTAPPQPPQPVQNMPGGIPFPGMMPGFPPGMLAPDTPPMPATDHPDAPPPGAVSGTHFDPQGFVRVEVDDPTPFVGQQATLRAWVYLPSTEAACDAQHEPQLTGFWNEPLIERGQTRCARQWFPQVVGGRQMFAGLLRKVAIFPTRAGRLEVGSIEVIGEYIEGDGFFGQRRQINVRSPAVVVEAREPAVDARPSGYVPGLIGPLQIEAELDRTTVATGETATLRIRATGNGYLGAAGLPPPPTVEGIRMHPGSSRNAIDKSDERNVRGTLINEYLIVPERPGAHALGVLHVPWFSPLEQRFHRATVVLPTLTATGAAQPREQETRREDPTLALDPYEPEPSLVPHRALITTAARAWMTLLVFPMVLAGWALSRALRRLGAARRLAAEDVARNDPDALMARAAERLTAGEATAAVDLAARALDRALKNHHALSNDLRKRVDETRSACDTFRFSGVGDAHAVVERVRDTLRALDQEP